MEDLAAQVKKELLRTLIWLIIALSVSIGVYFLIW